MQIITSFNNNHLIPIHPSPICIPNPNCHSTVIIWFRFILSFYICSFLYLFNFYFCFFYTYNENCIAHCMKNAFCNTHMHSCMHARMYVYMHACMCEYIKKRMPKIIQPLGLYIHQGND